MQKKESFLGLTSRKSNRIPTLPQIMNFNAKRRVNIGNINAKTQLTTSTKNLKFKTLNCHDSMKPQGKINKNPKIYELEALLNKCDNLANDT